MTFHWPPASDLDPLARCRAVMAVWEPGINARTIGERLGVTKNAIIGIYSRNPGLRQTHPLPKQVRSDKPRERKAKRVNVGPKSCKAIPAQKAAPLAPLNLVLFDLARGQCKWPVNDAAIGEQHLFCGHPAKGSYCAHHAARSVAQESGWGYR